MTKGFTAGANAALHELWAGDLVHRLTDHLLLILTFHLCPHIACTVAHTA